MASSTHWLNLQAEILARAEAFQQQAAEMRSAWQQQAETAEVLARAEAANLQAEASTSSGDVKAPEPKAMELKKKPAAKVYSKFQKKPASSAECPSEPLAPGAMEASPASLPPTLPCSGPDDEALRRPTDTKLEDSSPLQAAPKKRPGSQILKLVMKRPSQATSTKRPMASDSGSPAAQAVPLKRPSVAVGEAGRCDNVELPKSFADHFGPKGGPFQPAFSVTIVVWYKHLGRSVDYPCGRLEGQRQMWCMVKSGITEQLDNGELPSGEFFDAELIKTSARKLASEWVKSAAKRLEGTAAAVQFLNMDELC